jgi:hypothetical protein
VIEEGTRPPTEDVAQGPPAEDAPLARAQPSANRSGRPNSAMGAATEADLETPLLPSDETSTFEQRWLEIQAGFVDQPGQALAQADALVTELTERLAASFAEARAQLESQWERGDDASTEDLRIALMRYRSFFRRLLSA